METQSFTSAPQSGASVTRGLEGGLQSRPRPELLEATDAQIEDAVRHADPFVLRGLLYQLTGDESIAATKTARTGKRGVSFVDGGIDVVTLSADGRALIRAAAAKFLRSYRDRGAPPIDIGPAQRLDRSLALTAGEEIPTEDLPMWREELALNPWERGVELEASSDPERVRNFSAIVIGAGMGGLNMAAQLKHTGIPFTLLEKNSGVGGTWFENRYPGARVDSPSRSYSHIFGVDFEIPWAFCPRDVNQSYFDWVADRFELRDNIEFSTEVTSLVWDEAAAEWEVTSDGPTGTEVRRANAVITAVGLLSRPSIPAIEGMETFAGELFHTARWPDGLDVAGKRIAVVGTGCSGYQLTPELALLAGHVSLFQRTPNWVFATPGYRTPLAPQLNWLDRNMPYYANYVRFRTHWITGPQVVLKFLDLDPDYTEDPHARSAVNKLMRDGCVQFLQEKLGHRPELLEKMIPEHPPFSARPIAIDPDYSVMDALLRDNVALVTDGIVQMTPKGIVTKDGTEHELDIIVLATGFRANECLWPMDVCGRDGVTIDEAWAEDGPRAYNGTMVPGFPNLFMLYGPNTNAYGGGGIVNIEEMVSRYAIKCLRRLIARDERAVEVTESAYKRYNEELDEREKLKMYTDPRADNYYRNGHGRSSTQCPYPTNVLWHWLFEPDPADLVFA